MLGWLVNDAMTCIPGTRTLWHDLRDGLGLADHTGTPFPYLAQAIELRLSLGHSPDYIIRNSSYFRPIRTAIAQIVLVQDILTGDARRVQLDVMRQAAMIVYNSDYTRAHYPEAVALPHTVIPLGIDSDIFTILPDIPREDAIMFIGSHDPIKGFDAFMRLVACTPYQYIAVTKDAPVTHERVESHVRVTHSALALLMNRARLGLCLSRTETQHLAGIEMGLCGLPMLATPVGAYMGRPDGVWGRLTLPHDPLDSLIAMMESPCPDRQAVRDYWLDAGFSIGGCISAWKALVSQCVSQ